MSSGYALSFILEPELRDRISATLKTIDSSITCVPASSPQNALERMRNLEFKILIVTESNAKMKGSYLIQQANAIKNGTKPNAYLILSDEPTDTQSIPNVCQVGANPSEADLIEAIKKALAAAATASSPSPAKMDVSFINPFIESTVEVFKTTCSTSCRKTKVFLRGNEPLGSDISALVSLTSANLKGSMGIGFEKSTFLFLVNSMLGEKYTSITNENQDAAGELCNQIYGLTKTKLNNAGYQLQPAIPSVVVGDNHRIKHLLSGPIIVVQFDCEGGSFFIEAAMNGN